MKKLMKLSLLLVVVALTFSSCNCFKKMAKNSDDVSLTCAPEVLVLNNGVVAADITAQFPVKYFNPKAIVKVTPVMVFEGGEVAGTPKFFQGSKVKENYTVVDKKTGGVFTMHVEFPYDERMQISELQLRVEAKCPGSDEFTLVNANTGKVVKAKELEANPAIVRECGLVVAEGVNTLQQDLAYADAMAALPSDYKRVTTSVDKTEILYAINKANVTKKALKDADLEAFQANVDENLKNDRATQHVAVKGYASPDGPVKFNDTLSKERSESGDKVLAKLLKNSGLDIDVAAFGEDWEGFVRVLGDFPNLLKRDEVYEIIERYPDERDFCELQLQKLVPPPIYHRLLTEIYPALRRNEYRIEYNVRNFNLEEARRMVDERPDLLSLSEMYKVADSYGKGTPGYDKVMATALRYFPASPSALNENAVNAISREEYAKAVELLEKSEVTARSAELLSTLGVAYAGAGQYDKAEDVFRRASEAGSATARHNLEEVRQVIDQL